MRKNIFLILLLAYAGFLTYFSLLPGVEGGGLTDQFDKVLHMGAYFLLSVLAALTFFESGKKFGSWPFLFALFYGVFLEGVQHFIPSRWFDILDVFANGLGVVVGYFVWKVIKRRFFNSAG